MLEFAAIDLIETGDLPITEHLFFETGHLCQ